MNLHLELQRIIGDRVASLEFASNRVIEIRVALDASSGAPFDACTRALDALTEARTALECASVSLAHRASHIDQVRIGLRAAGEPPVLSGHGAKRKEIE